MTQTQECKQPIRQFMREHYTTERLCALLAHAQSGKLAFYSCCCFVGASTADHALRGHTGPLTADSEPHIWKARKLDSSHGYGMGCAETAFGNLGNSDKVRCRILIPMIRAELRRRERLAASEQLTEAYGLTESLPEFAQMQTLERQIFQKVNEWDKPDKAA